MKKYFAVSVILAGITQAAIAQKTDTAQILVHYKFTHVRDTTNRANAYSENMVLFVGANASSYKSYDRQLQNALFKKQIQEQLANSPDGRVKIQQKNTGSGTDYYQFPGDKKLVRKEPILMNTYLIDDELPAINWHIGRDTVSFGELHCQKATCHFKGRDYTAWFCPDLPVHVGPWKLNGLPGVIIEAYDAKKEVVFKFDRVEKAVLAAPAVRQPADVHPGLTVVTMGGDDADMDPNIIQLPTKGIKTSDKEYEKLRDAMRKDPNAFVQSMLASMPVNGGPKANINIKVLPQPPINNPIELPEK
ncbi:GLPGLI family protein [Mucilaginibacter pocheonensis]|uniref:GLPGLI family protein n=1 Tax=Mucilaginibacter pocheonensis TaxID=398050 RepID=A0ABU1TFE3_9SPHI|nr:GLPGLI family protein [Mucilaginibacter pocheonensis]MDR6944098.1 GLPGLI family protein [Mucilaginibacter pocheonensis]